MVEVSVTSPPRPRRRVPEGRRRSPSRSQGGAARPRPGDVRPRRGLALQAGRGGAGHGRPDAAPVPGARDPGRGIRGRLGAGRPAGRAAPVHHRRRSTAWSPAAWSTAARRTPTAAGSRCASPTRGSARWPRPTGPSTSTSSPSPATCPTRRRPWRCARSSCGPAPWPSPARARQADESAGPAAPERTSPVSKTEDRLDRRRRRTGHGNGRDRGDRPRRNRRAGCRLAAYVPMGVTSAATPRRRRPSTPTAPSRGSSGPTPIVMAHKVQFFSALIFSFLGPDHPGVDPQDPPERHHERADPADAAAAQLRRVDRRARRCSPGVFGYISRTNLFKVAYAIEFDLRNILYEHFTRMSFPFYDRVQSGQLISRANSDIRSVQMYLTFAPMILVQCSIAVVAFVLHALHQRAAGLRGHGVDAVHLPRRRQDAEVALPGLVADPVPPGRGGDRRRRERQRRARRAQLRRRAAAAAPAGDGGRPGAVGLHQGRRPAGPLRTAGAEPVPGRPGARPARRRLDGHPRPPAGRLHRLVQPLPRHDAGPVHDARDAHHDGPARLGLGRAHLRDPRRAADHRRPARRDRPGRQRGRRRVRRRVASPTPRTACCRSPARRTTAGATSCATSTSTCTPARPSPWSGGPGSGKSTVARVLARFYDATGGTVRVDGHDVRDLTLTSLRANIGVVLDEPFLFSVSIRDNIAYGRPDASMEEVRGRGRGGRRRRLHQPALRRATTPWSASGATRSRAASASASPSPAPCWSTRPS